MSSRRADSTPTLAEEIQAVVRSRPELLAASVEGLERLAAFVPAEPDAVHSFGFECRLVPGEHPVDLGVALDPAGAAARALAAARRDDERWRSIARFGERWGDPASAARRWIPFVFLEYDADAATAEVPVPSLFAALDSPLDRAEGIPELAAAREAAGLLSGGALTPALDAQLVACFERLPESGRALHVAVMLGRSRCSVRLSVLIPRDAAPAYFAALGARDAMAGVEELLDCGLDARDCVQLDFDLGPPIHGRIGLGLRPAASEGWRALLDAVLALDLCDPAKAEALLRWPGMAIAEVAGRGSSLLRRELSHLKLAVGAGGGLAAKAYLGATRLTQPSGGGSGARGGAGSVGSG